MKLWKTLENPVALAVQGFLAGTFLFLAVQPLSPESAPAPQPAGESILADLEASGPDRDSSAE